MLWILAQDSNQTGGSLLTLLLPIAMIAGLYFIMIRPQRNRQRQQQAMQGSLRIGDEVMISGGMFGILTEIDDDAGTVRVEIAPGTQIRMLRQGVLQRVTEDEMPDEDYDEPPDEEIDDRS
ncbi:MAG TPA: preprotein translocase subunit YajC [Actinomycetota bacterium]|nr:preprotein translocase subunit YajC [Actinomycetota bacterium]